VSRKENDDTRQASENARFHRMAEALSAGGMLAEHITPADLEGFDNAIANYNPDIAFCAFFRFDGHGDGEGYLRDSLLNAGVAWIGSSSDTMELALSKPRMKAHWRLNGILTPDWFIVRKFQDGSIDGLGMIENARDFPYIVKPSSEGNSRGIDGGSVVRSPLELCARASMIAEEYGEALVERYVSGGDDSREFTVAMIGIGVNAIVAAIEVRKGSMDSVVISEDDKDHQTTALLPVGDLRLKARIEDLARKIFMASGARDYARCDILLHEGKLYAIEMNGQPMVPDRWFEACACEAGLDERQYINAIAMAGIAGNARAGYAFIPIPQEMEKMLPNSIIERLNDKRRTGDEQTSWHR